MMKLFAHRGYSKKYPENTMLAFKKAYEKNFSGIELDVHLTKDNIPVVFHDETLDRLTNATGLIKNFTLSEIKEVNIYDKGYIEKIPTLEEYLEWVCNKNIETNIEIKTDNVCYNLIEEIILDLVVKYKLENKVIFSSFNHKTILKMKKLLEEKKLDIRLGFLNDKCILEPRQYLVENNIEYFHTSYDSFNDEILLDLVNNNIKVVVYTVDDINVIKELQSKQVSIVITNDCDNKL